MTPSRLRFLPLAAAAAFTAASCGAPTSSTAKYECSNTATGNGLPTIADTAGIFSINGGPPSGPSGVNTCTPAPVIAQPSALFDFVVDVEGTEAWVLPPKAVSSANSAGWRATTGAYDSITAAPTSGYNDSLPLPIAPGSVFFIQALKPGCALLSYQSQRYIYSKFIIDSIHYYPYNAVTAPAGLTVYYRMVVDPICGYTSLKPGIPTS